MTDEEMAKEYADEYGFGSDCNNLASYEANHEIEQTFLAGLEAGRPKWHYLRKNPEDLPETLHPVYAKLDSGTYCFAYCVNEIWHGNDDGIILYHGNGECEVIAWREIPRFEEE